jgi:hypothetical protein
VDVNARKSLGWWNITDGRYFDRYAEIKDKKINIL